MKNRILKLTSLFLLLSLLFTMVACNDTTGEPSASDASTEAPEVTFVPDQRYNIFRGDFYRNCDEIVYAVGTLQAAFRQTYGISCSSFASLSGDGPHYEILVGDTGRPESNEILAELRVNDYTYRVISENLIVICGGSAAATKEAVDKFCADMLGYTTTSSQSKTPLKVGASYTHRDNYAYSQVKINGLELSELTLAVSGGADLSTAQPLIRALGQYTGEHIRVVTYDQLTGSEKGVFCIGASNRAGDKMFSVDYGAYKISVDAEPGSFTVCMDASTALYRKRAIEDLLKAIDIAPVEQSVQITLSDCTLVDFDFGSSIPQWELKSETEQAIADGVTYTSQYYTDEENLPYMVHILEIDPSKASLYMGSSYDNYLYAPSSTQSVNGHMQSAMANGLLVVGGVNADFFDLGGDNHPKGLVIKEGQMISQGLDDRAYIGFTYDGQVVIDSTPFSHTKYNLRTAVGGSHMIVKNGLPFDFGGSDDFSVTAHPRTLAGVKEDGTILLVVVDGRQSKVSNGAPLKRCAQLMVELGAVSAINLDGGGSSTLSVVESGTVVTKNSPSGGTLRKVYNSLLVVLNPQQ